MRTRSALVLLTVGALSLYWGCAGEESDDDDDVTSPTGAGTQAGTGTGGGTSTATGTATTTGTGVGSGGGGGAGDTCSHDVCDVGEALVSTCGACAADVCDHEDWCCSVEWDDNCVLLVGPICPSVTCGGAGAGGGGVGGGGVGGGSAGSGGIGGTGGGGGGGVVGPCSHDVCDPGLPLVSGCDSCATAVCQADSWCCSIDWDAFCIQHVEDECPGMTCGGMGGGGAGGMGGGGAGGSGGGTVHPGDLVITEIMNNPDAVTDDYGEWFEVYNATSGSIDMQGLVLRHQFITYDPTATHTISSSLVVSAGGYVVLGSNAETSSNGNVSIDYEYPGSLNLSNSRDYLAVETDTGIVIDETRWNEDAFDPTGRSRSLDPQHLSAADNDDDTNFCEATSYIQGSPDRGTPGSANDSCP